MLPVDAPVADDRMIIVLIDATGRIAIVDVFGKLDDADLQRALSSTGKLNSVEVPDVAFQ